MSKFNLLDEPWISVVSNDGRQIDVSILELFQNAGSYVRLAGEMETQNFAVLRMLLAILQTVFSRYDYDGNAIVPVGDCMRQTEEIEDDEDTRDDYIDALENTWEKLWDSGTFPEILFQYLYMWHDRFYLFDDEHPFYQVTKSEFERYLPEGKNASPVAGRFLNRIISESGNKTAFFSPVSGKGKDTHKDILTEAALARWLIAFQGYTGLSDKTTLYAKDRGFKPSKGWLFDLGGIYLGGSNLYETLVLNTILIHPDERFNYQIQRPCWESEQEGVLSRLIRGQPISNIAELYTNWSRAVYINPDTEIPGPVNIYIGKLPALVHTDAFLEPMTLWKEVKTGEDKGHFSPRKHMPHQAMWRSFGIITLPTSDGQYQPGIQVCLNKRISNIGNRHLSVYAVSMQDDANATSWLPVDEISDVLAVNDVVMTDDSLDGWIIRINGAVSDTKEVVESIFGGYLRDIVKIRGMDEKAGREFFSRESGDLYQEIDGPFRNWLEGIHPEDSKEKKILQWQDIMVNITVQKAKAFAHNTLPRDYIGIEDKSGILNIATAYRKFFGRLRKRFRQEGSVIGIEEQE